MGRAVISLILWYKKGSLFTCRYLGRWW